MKRYITYSFCRVTWLMTVLLMSILNVHAQTNISIGSGTTGNEISWYPCPLQDYQDGARAQYMYRASELQAAGMGPGLISALSFKVLNLRGVGLVDNFTIRIGAVSAVQLNETTWETVPNIIYGPAHYQPVIGANTFHFATSFLWNGQDNIVVEVCNGDDDTSNENPEVAFTSLLDFKAAHTTVANSQGSLCGTTNTDNRGDLYTRTNIVFEWTAAAVCTGVPVAGTAIADASDVCKTYKANLSLTGTTVASGLTYQWQSSPDNATWTNISAATTPGYTATQTITTWYRCVVTCPTGGSSNSGSVQVVSPLPVSGTYTINSAVVTGGTNFQSFNDAVNFIECGINGPVVFNVVTASGPYNEQVVIPAIPGASATNTITFNGNGANVHYLSTVSSTPAVIELDGADYITINNLGVTAEGTGWNQYGIGIHLTNDADFNTISNCTIQSDLLSGDQNYAGIAINGGSFITASDSKCDNNTISGNTITGGYHGITLYGSLQQAARDNKIINNTIHDFHRAGIIAEGTFGLLIENNEISRPARTVAWGFNGISLNGLNTKAIITRNRISNPYSANADKLDDCYGISLEGVGALPTLENKITNNLIYNMNAGGNVDGIHVYICNNAWFYHNTIVLDGATTAPTYLSKGLYIDANSGGINFNNNIVSITRTGGGKKYAIYLESPSGDQNINRNDYYIATSVQEAAIGFYGADQVTLLQWKTATSLDAATVSVNPLFTDITTGNYTPQNNSLNDLGTNQTVSVDITSAARSTTTPDLGAYEFTPPVCTSPPIAGTTTLSANPVCINTQVVLGLTGNSIGVGQTYQWQTSITQTGTYVALGDVQNSSDTVIVAATTLWYRVALTCSGNISYSTPILLIVNPAVVGGTYTIDKGAPATATNFTSFSSAADALSCGITGPVVFNVVANSGPYLEQLIIDTIKGASAINTVTFNGNGNTIAFGSANSLERAVVKLRRADHVILDSLTIDATGGTYGYGVQLINNADSNTISRCKIIAETNNNGFEFSGIVMSGSEDFPASEGSLCDGNTLTNNTITGGDYGITLYGSDAVRVTGNRITNNVITEFYRHAIYLDHTINTVVSNNSISRPTRVNVSGFNGIFSNEFTGLLIENNKLFNPFGPDPSPYGDVEGIHLENSRGTGADNVVRNNILYNIRTNGSINAFYNAFSDNTYYYHNTVSIDDPNTTSTNNIMGYVQYGDITKVVFQNNIISINRGGTGQKTGVNLANGTSGLTVNNNNYFVKNGFIGNTNSTNYATLAAWQAASSMDAASTNVEPVYADIVTGNLAPVISPLDNTGAAVGVTKDINSVTRSTTKPDVGAFEITIPPCTTPPTAGITIVDPTTAICMGDSVKLTLQGNSTGGTQTYQWQSAKSATGPWTDFGDVQYVAFTSTELAFDNYFRCAVTCGGNTAYSSPAQVLTNAALAAGTYTINPALPAGVTNFQTFSAAVAALECGINGNITFLATAGTYNEQIRMHHIPGAAADRRVSFRSATNDAASVILTYASSDYSFNYTLQLDSASYVTYDAITIRATDPDRGRAIYLAGTTSYDSIVNCKVIAPVVASSSTDIVGIYAEGFSGGFNVIKGNTILNGGSGIYMSGLNDANKYTDHVIDSNIVTGAFKYGIYVTLNSRLKLHNNIVDLSGASSSSVYGMFLQYADTSCYVTHNKITISNNTKTVYGIYYNYSSGTTNSPDTLASNTVIAVTGNTGDMYGIYTTDNNYVNTLNNVVSIKTTSATAYGLYAKNDEQGVYYNNSIYNASPTIGTKNSAAYMSHSNPGMVVRNNIFAHDAGGRALIANNAANENIDYNTLYSTGAVLAATSKFNYATLPLWIAGAKLDQHSIVYKPAFISITDLHPDVASPDVWAIHGRGIQMPGNDHDFNNQPRPVTLAAGVPDMGAYEFVPTSVPAALTAVPAAPVAGTTQTFLFGSDTVANITWGASVPSAITVKRYTGVAPTGLSPAAQFMYFFTDVDATGAGPFDYTINQHYMDPWQGTVKNQALIQLGRTDAADKWITGDSSKVDETNNYITESKLTFPDKFTGLVDSARAVVPVVIQPADSSNTGTRFWVGYGHHEFFGSDNEQDMVLYFSATEDADVTVKINNTGWIKHYHVPANAAVTSDIIPKTGIEDARLLTEGISDRGISIESTKPIAAYAHIYGDQSSGATMLLPVGTYGYEYYSLNYNQRYSYLDYSWAYVVADQPNTVVEITPSVPSATGHEANVPYTVILNKGEIYQFLAARISGDLGYDATGTKFRSVTNSEGKCYPIGVFSGSSRNSVSCEPGGSGGNGDNFIQQCFPAQAWGKRYLTAPTSTDEDPAVTMGNVYRVLVKDPTTVVKINGTVLKGLNNGRFYQYVSTTADYIEANQPIMIAQYMTGWNRCFNTGGMGDPEMIYLSPIEQGIKQTGFYRNTEEGIEVNYLTLIIPTGGISSLKIDGSNLFDRTYKHPALPGYTVVVKYWSADKAQSIVKSDSAFTAITYGLGDSESYGYNAGTLVRNLNTRSSITNVHSDSTSTSDHTCVNTPFRFTFITTQRPASIIWGISAVSNISPSTDITQTNPVPVDSFIANNKKYYRFVIKQEYSFSKPGTYYVPVTMLDPTFEGCDNKLLTYLPVTVLASPVVSFTYAFNGCVSDSVKFTGNAVTTGNIAVNEWNWAFGNGTVDNVKSPAHLFTAGGTYAVKLEIVSADGCVADTTGNLVVKGPASGIIVTDSVTACIGSDVTFTVQSPAADVDYFWYDAANGGTRVGTGSTFTITNATTSANYYLETMKDGCTGPARTIAKMIVLPVLTAPVAVLDSTGVNTLRFIWAAVPNATGYEVSTDGLNWMAVADLQYTINGLKSMQEVTFHIRALGCETVVGAPVTGTTLLDGIYIPNVFTPNGDAVNDQFKIYGYIIKDVRMMIFDQWGEKLYETNDQSRGWDGLYKGKPQPSGVYMYVVRLQLLDGSTVDKKGIINLIR
ncbi:gliding motility-associated C-terminal domain-containing protein [Chitinophaga sp. CF118]|uniref:right-handed parallel beta-helix repeat-containing protein n=1 Tax=Chitinophaga sp. CF118 TaxID=1884367 RepID=UPI0008E5EF82|nr:right-handed parallel beta-helix repeat-containing protein [Chitinophaga sp. CF118]SFE97086.1 gliding motility-associated C-terminal domain-containing protein [Chitinophaga sp. CF118]